MNSFLTDNAMAAETIWCLRIFITFIIPCVLILLPIRLFTKIPSYVFRKLLHIVAFSCVMIMIIKARNWQAAAMASIVIAVVIYPVLRLFENRPWYADLFVLKEPGEIRKSLLMLFLMFAAVTAVTWGIFDKSYYAAAAILMWGTGDAAAALVGIPYGKHKVTLKLADGKKSWEGSTAMFIVSLISGFCVLFFGHGSSVSVSLLAACAGALSGTVTEFFSSSEWDTVTVPAVIAAVLLLVG
jgi:dolichol kinase